MDLNDVIKQRHSVRKFKNTVPDWRLIIEAIDSVKYTPMAGNIFSLKVIIVDDREKIEMIANCCQQDFVKTTNYLVIVCSNPSMTQTHYGQDAMKYARQQAGAAIQTFLLKLTELGLTTTWIGYFAEDIIKRELKIPNKVEVEAIFPIGHEFKSAKTRRLKPDMDSFLYFNEYGNKKMKTEKKLDV